VSVALLQIWDAGAGQFGFEVLVAPREMQAAITAGRAQRIARVRVVIPSLCNGGSRAALRRRCHVNCWQKGCCRGVRKDAVNSFSRQKVNVVASTVSHVLELSAVLWVRVARIWVTPVTEILVKEGRWKLSKA
jgi:hypothetical protein